VSPFCHSIKPALTFRLGFYSQGTGDCAKGMTFGLNPNSSETEAEFQGVAMAEASTAAENKPSSEGTSHGSSGGTSTAVKIGVSIGVVIFALLVAAAFFRASFVHRRQRQGIQIPELPELGLPDFASKDYNQAKIKPPVPIENYELVTTDSKAENLVALRHELASPVAELP
jgi:hypothetical protein